MKDIIRSKTVVTLKELLTKEMERLQKRRLDNPQWWADLSSSGWAREEYGDNLDTITPLAIERESENCQICGRSFELEEWFIRLIFSFCREYGCEMNICKKCLSLMSKELK